MIGHDESLALWNEQGLCLLVEIVQNDLADSRVQHFVLLLDDLEVSDKLILRRQYLSHGASVEAFLFAEQEKSVGMLGQNHSLVLVRLNLPDMSVLQQFLDDSRLVDLGLTLKKTQLIIAVVSPREKKLLLAIQLRMSLNGKGSSVVSRNAHCDRVEVTSCYVHHFHVEKSKDHLGLQNVN